MKRMVEEIRAELVGNVYQVPVSAGQRVTAGDTVIILESMKMEIPVLAETSGTLGKLAVKEGDVIRAGDLIGVVTHPDAAEMQCG